MSAPGPDLWYWTVPGTVLTMQYVVAFATEILMFLIPASYEPCSFVSVTPVYPVEWSALYASIPGTAARTFACAAELLARLRKLRYEGIAIASRIPRMMITTRSSISVKPFSSRTRCRIFESMLCCSLRLVGVTVAWRCIGVRCLASHPRLGDEPGKKKGRGFPRPFRINP